MAREKLKALSIIPSRYEKMYQYGKLVANTEKK
jgi:hypothetical protein